MGKMVKFKGITLCIIVLLQVVEVRADICLDSSIHHFEKVVYVPQKKEVLFLSNYDPSPNEQRYLGTDLILIITDTAFNVKKKLFFGNKERGDVGQDIIVDRFGNYVVLSTMQVLYPTETNIPKPTIITVINSKYEIVSTDRFDGEGFALTESENGYLVFGTQLEDEASVDYPVYMAQVVNRKERWRNKITLMNSIFHSYKMKPLKNNRFALVTSKEAYQIQMSDNDLNAGFDHMLTIVDSAGMIQRSIILQGVPREAYVCDWHLLVDELYLLMTSVTGYYSSNIHHTITHFFVKYNLKTGKTSKQILATDSVGLELKYIPMEIFLKDRELLVWYFKDYKKKQTGVLRKWGQSTILKQEEWTYSFGKSDLKFIFIGSKRYIAIAEKNGKKDYAHNLLVKRW